MTTYLDQSLCTIDIYQSEFGGGIFDNEYFLRLVSYLMQCPESDVIEKKVLLNIKKDNGEKLQGSNSAREILRQLVINKYIEEVRIPNDTRGIYVRVLDRFIEKIGYIEKKVEQIKIDSNKKSSQNRQGRYKKVS